MKDQQRLVRRCLEGEIPVFVLCGTDINAVDTLEHYYRQATDNGASTEFLNDLRLLILDFRAYRSAEPEQVKQPD